MDDMDENSSQWGGGGEERRDDGIAHAKQIFQVDAELLVRGAVAIAVEVKFEIRQHVGRRLVTLVSLANERALDDRFEPRLDFRPKGGKLRNRQAENVATGVRAIRRAENVFPHQQLRENNAERKEIGAGVGDGVAG